MYKKFGEEFDDRYKLLARSAIRDAASQFSAYDYFKNRQAVAARMEILVKENLSTFHAKVNSKYK